MKCVFFKKPDTRTLLLLLAALLFITPASADSGLGSFFTWVAGIGEDFWLLVTQESPDMIDRFFAWVIEWAIYLKFQLELAAIKTAWNIAKVILTDLQFGNQLNALLALLPPDMQAAIMKLRILDGIEILINAMLTKFVLDFMR